MRVNEKACGDDGDVPCSDCLRWLIGGDYHHNRPDYHHNRPDYHDYRADNHDD